MLDLEDQAAYDAFISSPSQTNQTHVIIMHTASWCGPCRSCKPFYSALASEWSNPTNNKGPLPLTCATAFEDKIKAPNCRGYPLFRLWDCVNKREVGEVYGGGDLNHLKTMVEERVQRLGRDVCMADSTAESKQDEVWFGGGGGVGGGDSKVVCDGGVCR